MTLENSYESIYAPSLSFFPFL